MVRTREMRENQNFDIAVLRKISAGNQFSRTEKNASVLRKLGRACRSAPPAGCSNASLSPVATCTTLRLNPHRPSAVLHAWHAIHEPSSIVSGMFSATSTRLCHCNVASRTHPAVIEFHPVQKNFQKSNLPRNRRI